MISFKEGIKAFMLAGALSVGCSDGTKAEIGKETPQKIVRSKEHFSVRAEACSFDNNPDFFQKFPNGDFSEKERKKRTEVINKNVVIFHDVGVDFYTVQKGDTIEKIRDILSNMPKYSYLKSQKEKLKSFNIPAREIKAGMLLPIPLENEDRHISDEQFVAYADQALHEMLESEEYKGYKKEIEKMIEKAGSEEGVIQFMLAIAKQESGGKPIGQFEMHRWEKSRQKFSFSIFHVLMEGPGLKGRQNLDLTEGQLYHPKNACKLFLAFMIEKSRERNKEACDFFPLQEHTSDIASFYNGKNWKGNNPDYVKNITRYFIEAGGLFDKLKEHP